MESLTVETSTYKKTNMRSKQQRDALLIRAKILDTNGHYVEKFFSTETIQKDLEHRQGK